MQAVRSKPAPRVRRGTKRVRALDGARPVLRTEHVEQREFVSWFRKTFPAVRILAIPNGSQRSRTTGARLKAEGVVAGAFLAPLMLSRAPQSLPHGECASAPSPVGPLCASKIKLCASGASSSCARMRSELAAASDTPHRSAYMSAFLSRLCPPEESGRPPATLRRKASKSPRPQPTFERCKSSCISRTASKRGPRPSRG